MPSSDLRVLVKAFDPGERCAARTPDQECLPKKESRCQGAASSAFLGASL